MNLKMFKADIMLLITAAVWGSAFVAQIVAMDHMGPYLFNGIRFAIGAVFLIPFIRLFPGGSRSEKTAKQKLFAGIIVGLFLFAGSTLQQIGLKYTTAANGGFITGLYVIIVPFMSLMLGFRPNINQILGVFIAFVGLYLVSIPEGSGFSSVNYGDILVFIGAFFWAMHVIVIGKAAPKMNPILLSSLQFGVCSFLSLLIAFTIENISINGIQGASLPLLYSGFLSVGLAYTLQVVAQKDASPTHAVIILTLESVFAAISGWIYLAEDFNQRKLIGCIIMFSAMIISQFTWFKKQQKKSV